MYLKPQKHKKYGHKKAIIIIVIAVVVLGVAAFVFFQMNKEKQKSTIPSQSGHTSQSTQNNNSNQSNSTNDPKKIKQNEGADPNNSPTLTGHITSAFLANGQFSLRVNIDQYVSEGGTCKLTLIKGGQTITKEAPLVADVSSSTCQGFDSSDSSISSGTWHVMIDLKSNNGKTGKIESEVNL